MTRTNWKAVGLDVVAVAARWAVGGLFIYMGLNKALHPVEFLKLVRQYDMVSNHLLLNLIASALPWFEVLCGLLLVAGVAVRGAALMLAGMLVPFTALVVHRALGIAGAKGLAFCAVKFDCGCGNGEVFICAKIVENAILFLVSCFLLSGRGRQLAVRFDLLRTGTAPASSAPS